MSVKFGVCLIIGIFGVLLTVVSMQGLLAGEWTIVAQSVAAVSVMIAVFGIVMQAIFRR